MLELKGGRRQASGGRKEALPLALQPPASCLRFYEPITPVIGEEAVA